MIDAVSHLDDSYQLIIAGECYGSFEKYQKQIDKSPAKERIFVHNHYINDDDIPLFFSSADALVLPYRSATQSGVVSIAYHYNLPMVSTPVGDFLQSIAEPQTGIVVHEISVKALKEGIQSLFAEDKLTFITQQIEKEKVALSWETLTKKLLSFIYHLV